MAPTLNDSPIRTPGEDRYAFDPFAGALARSIAQMNAPEGVVVAINGTWGSGKSSVVNLVLHHLRSEVDARRIEVVPFSPWWFAGQEPLTRAFFEALGTALNDALRGKVKKKAKQALNAVFQRVRPGKQVGAVGADLVAGGTPVGTAATAALDLGMEYLNAKRPIEEEYERLADALRGQSRRLLVVVDDIDRLDAEDAMLVFRLIKSVGRLPNVIYLLAFHAEVADRHLRRRFDSSASEYLEKVVQVSYELPVPARPLLLHALLHELQPILPALEVSGSMTRFGNLVHDCVAPWLTTPRDVARLVNAIRVGWPAVAGEVDAADFVALEAVKLSHPTIYRAIQTNPQALCGLQPTSGMDRRRTETAADRYDELLLAEAPEAERGKLRIALRRLFPRLDAIWANLWHGPDAAQAWHRQRLVCSRPHFDAYFLLAPGDQAVPASEIAELVAQADDAGGFIAVFRQAVTMRRKVDGRSRASLLLDELRMRAGEIPVGSVRTLLEALSRIADDLEVPEDDIMSGWGNQLRLWHLIRDLTQDRIDQAARSALLTGMAGYAQVGWLSWIADHMWDEHHPGDGRQVEHAREPLVTLAAAEALRAAALEAIRDAARTGTLLTHGKLRELLFAWARYATDEGVQARHWTNRLLDDDRSVVRLAEAATFMGERIALEGFGFLVTVFPLGRHRWIAPPLAR